VPAATSSATSCGSFLSSAKFAREVISAIVAPSGEISTLETPTSRRRSRPTARRSR